MLQDRRKPSRPSMHSASVANRRVRTEWWADSDDDAHTAAKPGQRSTTTH